MLNNNYKFFDYIKNLKKKSLTIDTNMVQYISDSNNKSINYSINLHDKYKKKYFILKNVMSPESCLSIYDKLKIFLIYSGCFSIFYLFRL